MICQNIIFLNFETNFNMCRYEMDRTSIVEDTERTRFCPQTDRRTTWNQYTPTFNFVNAGEESHHFDSQIEDIFTMRSHWRHALPNQIDYQGARYWSLYGGIHHVRWITRTRKAGIVSIPLRHHNLGARRDVLERCDGPMTILLYIHEPGRFPITWDRTIRLCIVFV